MRNIYSVGMAVLLLTASNLTGCAITSPYWGYVPDSISAPIPFQAWSGSTSALHIECADETTGHGNPSDGEASYIPVATMNPSSSPSLDSTGQAIYPASTKVALPSECWDWFSDYNFWQANVRVVLVNASGRKVPFANYDLDGLSCLGRETGKVGRWNGSVNKGCEMKFANTGDLIPYIVLRIDGYQNGINGLPGLRQAPRKTPATATDVLPSDAPLFTPVPKPPKT